MTAQINVKGSVQPIIIKNAKAMTVNALNGTLEIFTTKFYKKQSYNLADVLFAQII